MSPLGRALPFLLIAACSGGTPPPAPPPDPEPAPEPTEAELAADEPSVEAVPEVETDGTPEGPACDRSEDCEGESQCRGPAGCDAAWACGEPRECGDHQVGWCGCDGFTFYAPENCPGRRYVHSGPCEDLGVVDDEPLEEVEGNSVCRSSDDCPTGWVCAGTEGCSTLWTCVRRVRMRPRCRRTQGTFCSCEGDTFEAQAACPGQPFLHRGYCPGDESALAEADLDGGTPSATATAQPPAASGPRVCVRNRDCPRGQTCMGTEGCTSDWHCGRPVERCIADTQYFCSCGGETFTSSMTCPGQPHRHRGSCAAE